MRNAFCRELETIVHEDPSVMLLTADLGYSVFDGFRERYPENFLNMGISEQHMTGFAAGLAIAGFRPIIYSIVPFVTMRNFEQVRNDVCYQNLDVKIVGVGAGFSYGPYGHTHHGVEDIAVMRSIPGMTVICPGDPLEAEAATRAMMAYHSPVYLRLGKAGEPNVHKVPVRFSIGKGIVVTEGTDVTLIASSVLLSRASDVSGVLSSQGISVRFVSMPTIKPIDREIICRSVETTRAIVTVEEHSVIGGLGSAVAEVIASHGKAVRFRALGISDMFTHTIGNQDHMRKANGLDLDAIVHSVKELLAS